MTTEIIDRAVMTHPTDYLSFRTNVITVAISIIVDRRSHKRKRKINIINVRCVSVRREW